MSEAASRLEAISDELKQSSRRFAVVNAADYARLDLEWYGASERRLSGLSYRLLGDIADLDHNEKHPTSRAFVRVLVSADGETMAGLYHYLDSRLEVRANPFSDVQVLDLETEFSDGSFVITSDMPRRAALDMGPAIDRRIVDTHDLAFLDRAHAAHLATHRARFPGTRAIGQRTLEDVIHAQEREVAVRAKYRQQMQVPFTEDELNNVTGHQRPDVVRSVSDELRSRFPLP